MPSVKNRASTVLQIVELADGLSPLDLSYAIACLNELAKAQTEGAKRGRPPKSAEPKPDNLGVNAVDTIGVDASVQVQS